MKPFELLSQKFNASSHIEAFREMQDFILLWMIFEKEVLSIKNEYRRGDKIVGGRKNVTTELAHLEQHIPEKQIDDELLKKVCQKQKELYIDSTDTTRLFSTFRFDNNQKRLIEKAFIAETATKDELLQAALTAIYKYRCKFIHGDKELLNLHTRQHDRFSLYSELLAECINAKKNSHEDASGNAYRKG